MDWTGEDRAAFAQRRAAPAAIMARAAKAVDSGRGAAFRNATETLGASAGGPGFGPVAARLSFDPATPTDRPFRP
ncbi:hypothetical protein ATO6_14825 [Oceanicola sp. 22II-s10i]|nr:hypothetical protein ATO6_14825 [Oceanicola sp. 22II-s10i]